MKLSDLVGKDNNTLFTLIINGEKGPLMTQRTLALSGLRLQGGPMIPSKGGVFRRQGKDRHDADGFAATASESWDGGH